jgi:predicted lipoprotein with Yx(FWY)xxD motif
VNVQKNPTFGNILIDSAGKALYTYGPDKGHNGKATCTGACLVAWPPLTVPAGTTPTAGPGVHGTLAAVKQVDGVYQVTHDGLPLYTFASDPAAGQVTGSGIGGFAVATDGSSIAGGSGAGGNTTSTTTTAQTSGGAVY